jgi:hypothetical protein
MDVEDTVARTTVSGGDRDKKILIIQKYLARIKERKVRNYKKYTTMKKRLTACKAVINILNTASVTSLAITFAGLPVVLISTAITATLSAIGTGVLTVIDMDRKVQSHHTSYLQLSDLHATYEASLLKTNLTEDEIYHMLQELNTKVGLILDSSEPVSISLST